MPKLPGIREVLDFVIVTEFDSPRVRQVNVLFVGEDSKRYVAYCRDWRDVPPSVRCQEAETDDELFPLSSFGVSLFLEAGSLFAQENGGTSTAKYRDGKPRRWEGRDWEQVAIEPRLADAVERALLTPDVARWEAEGGHPC